MATATDDNAEIRNLDARLFEKSTCRYTRLRCIIYEDYYTFTMYGILYADSINKGRNVSTNNPASNISASVILSVNL